MTRCHQHWCLWWRPLPAWSWRLLTEWRAEQATRQSYVLCSLYAMNIDCQCRTKTGVAVNEANRNAPLSPFDISSRMLNVKRSSPRHTQRRNPCYLHYQDTPDTCRMYGRLSVIAVCWRRVQSKCEMKRTDYVEKNFAYFNAAIRTFCWLLQFDDRRLSDNCSLTSHWVFIDLSTAVSIRRLTADTRGKLCSWVSADFHTNSWHNMDIC